MTPLRPKSLAEFELFCSRAHPGQLIEPPPGWTLQHIMEAFPDGLPGGFARLAPPEAPVQEPEPPKLPPPRPHRVEVTLSNEEYADLAELANLEGRSLANAIRTAVSAKLTATRGPASPSAEKGPS